MDIVMVSNDKNGSSTIGSYDANTGTGEEEAHPFPYTGDDECEICLAFLGVLLLVLL